MTPVFQTQSMTLRVSLLAAGDTTLSFDYLSTGRWSETFLEFTSFLARTKMMKTVILLPKPLERMAQTFFRLPQCLIKQMLHDLLYIFLWQTLKPLSTHIRWRKSFLCRFYFSTALISISLQPWSTYANFKESILRGKHFNGDFSSCEQTTSHRLKPRRFSKQEKPPATRDGLLLLLHQM